MAILLVVICSIGGLSQTVSIKTALIELTIPKIYIVFLAPYTTAMSIYDSLSHALLIAFQGKAASRLSRRLTNPSMLVVPFGSVAEWTFLPENRFDLLRVKRSFFGEFSALAVVILPALCLYFSIYIMIFAQVFAHLSSTSSQVFMGKPIAGLAVLIAVAPLVFLPFPFQQRPISKNLVASDGASCFKYIAAMVGCRRRWEGGLAGKASIHERGPFGAICQTIRLLRKSIAPPPRAVPYVGYLLQQCRVLRSRS